MKLKQLLIMVGGLMSIAGGIEEFKTGKQKKEFVLREVAKNITLNNELEEFIIELIDEFISVEKGEMSFNGKKARRSIKSIFKLITCDRVTGCC
jgi:hypothetical protein